ncbi:FdhF/YdeP family oxidoreductase [Novosphingobium taihuense]|uniref:Molybdopterin-dependent oxidoreductase alpha subunit n=2 Tax=Novosphingobium taihuense TaxID=260085 RepID=A0A7W7AEQ5_9SPHN|nr:FdhF/YdeP family oxidoreductase [Novosphingobium taihuense]MBB4615667.1 molybdopterin-dependent oxidoreductase alpha subunit [Novosphingobium taihuense]TWH79599.1 molybdopterin-dependent oxidoreductase alpha subunit [Novosphingobium taihuense]
MPSRMTPTDEAAAIDVPEPAGGWGSLKGIASIELSQAAGPGVLETLAHLNKPDGTACTSCAWIKPPTPAALEFCENGAKATLWDLTSARATPEFFEDHTVSDLWSWSAHDLEKQGRLTEPLRYEPATDRYVRATWDEAFAAIGSKLKQTSPEAMTFYASGKAALEPSYLYAIFARMLGHNNLPDSSNMCHETTSVGLKKVIGSPVGTCQIEDFDQCDAIFYLGQNPGTNSPRILHPLQQAVKRGCRIVTFNPLKEAGLVEFINPQSPVEMLTGKATRLSHLYLQVRPGGDIAALMGVCKHVLARADREPGLLDEKFLAEHTQGYSAFREKVGATDWPALEAASGVTRAEMEAAGDVYAEAKAVIGIYGMGLTQQVHGSEAIGLLVNLLLLRGNIGRPGAGCSPIRGHSNVQGQRTVGITEKVALAPVEKYREVLGLETPEQDGHNTHAFLEALLAGRNRVYLGLGGNLAMAVPDHGPVHEAWRQMDLTVHVATRLNHTHLLPGRESWILPCLVRSEEDVQASGNQFVSIEDSFSHIYSSKGKRTPASEHQMSETAIICELAKASLPFHPRWLWDEWRADYARIRDLIAQTYPDQFFDMEARMHEPGGFYRGNDARKRIWHTNSGKAEFTDPTALNAGPEGDALRLITLRSNDQFNTTIYGHSDRLRGLEGERTVVLVSKAEMARQGLSEGQRVTLVTAMEEERRRAVSGLKVVAYDLPDGCVAGYFPELNPLVPLSLRDSLSDTPASKAIPVRFET